MLRLERLLLFVVIILIISKRINKTTKHEKDRKNGGRMESATF
jgi:hypothetical protein